MLQDTNELADSRNDQLNHFVDGRVAERGYLVVIDVAILINYWRRCVRTETSARVVRQVNDQSEWTDREKERQIKGQKRGKKEMENNRSDVHFVNKSMAVHVINMFLLGGRREDSNNGSQMDLT